MFISKAKYDNNAAGLVVHYKGGFSKGYPLSGWWCTKFYAQRLRSRKWLSMKPWLGFGFVPYGYGLFSSKMALGMAY